MIPTAALTTPEQAAGQRLNAAVRDAALIIRTSGQNSPEGAHTLAAMILQHAGLSADRILGHQTRSYPQTFQLGSPIASSRGH